VILRMMMLCSIDFTSQYEREKARGFSHTHDTPPRSQIAYDTRVTFDSVFRFRVSSAGGLRV